MNNRKLLALMLMLSLLFSCGGKTDDPTPPDDNNPILTIIGDDEFHFAIDGGSSTLKFTANKNWTAEADADWVTLDPASGAAGENISVSVVCEKTPKTNKRSTDVTLAIEGKRVFLSVSQDGDPMAGAAEELVSGSVVQANSLLTEKFLTEVTYEDKTYKEYTKVFDYYGGFDGKNFNWDNWGTEWPDGDMPCQYSIRWKKEDMEDGAMTLHLEDNLGWSGEMEVAAGSRYVNITNLCLMTSTLTA